MAQHGAAHHGSAMDYSEHEKTYGFFIGLVKYGTAFVVILMFLLWAFVA